MVSDAPNVLFLVFDTLRYDRVSGYPGAVSDASTPTIDAVGSRGVTFERAFSAGPGTEVSHGAMFTGQFPSETGLVGGGRTIPSGLPLLAEWFSEYGYRTFGISGPAKLRSELGFDRGFDEYVEPYRDPLEPELSVDYLRSLVTSSAIRDDVIRLLTDGPDSRTEVKFNLLRDAFADADGPFFGFANFTTCHASYNPPRPYREQATPSYHRPRWFAMEKILRALGYQPERIDDADARIERVIRTAGNQGWPYYGDSSWLTDTELDIIRSWYTATARYLDDRLGAFLDGLEEQGVLDDTILVLTSDHGEYLGAHELLYHGDFLYDEVIRVPLVMAGPGVDSRRVETTLASLVDVFPTLCDLTGVPEPETITGISLFEDSRTATFAEYGPRPDEHFKGNHYEYVSDKELEEFAAGRKCIRTEDYKLVLSSTGETTLYQLPAEQPVTDSTVEERLTERLLNELGEEFHESERQGGEMAADVRENLRELGYM